MAKGDVLGMIDCPHCGLKGGMRITEDKNGQPFGFCEAECDGQLRVGGKPRRVEMFYKLHPHLKKKGESPAATAGAVPVAPAKPADATATAPAAPAKPKRAAFDMGAL
jgi:hypothetical protein